MKKGSDPFLGARETQALIRLALREDGFYDLTTKALTIKGLAEGMLLAKSSGVLAGGPIFEAVIRSVDPKVRIAWKVREGGLCRRGQVVAVMTGSAAGLLKAERPALNFLQRLSGIATVTRQYVDQVRGTRTVILDTRKTTPGFRVLEKYAVRMGGGTNHRSSLNEAILIKDNHLRFMPSVGEAVRRTVKKHPKAQVEVNTFRQLQEAVTAGARMVLLDNFSSPDLRKALKWATGGSPRGTPKGSGAKGKVITEVSGGMTLQAARQAARWGANRISVGALTHSVKAMDFSLELYPFPRSGR